MKKILALLLPLLITTAQAQSDFLPGSIDEKGSGRILKIRCLDFEYNHNCEVIQFQLFNKKRTGTPVGIPLSFSMVKEMTPWNACNLGAKEYCGNPLGWDSFRQHSTFTAALAYSVLLPGTAINYLSNQYLHDKGNRLRIMRKATLKTYLGHNWKVTPQVFELIMEEVRGYQF